MAAWYDRAVFYHIYPLGLCGCEKENDYKAHESQFPKLAQWAEHIADLGCTAIYIGPLFESATHGYDTTDYKKVDGRLGTNDDFKNWVSYCHSLGLKVVVDGVFNHTGRDFEAFRNLIENKWTSWAKDWYCSVDFNGHSAYGDDFSYESWEGHAQLPKLNMQNQAVRDYMLSVVRFWADKFDIDGIRLDCANVLDFEFMRQLRALTDTLKPEFWLMGEVIHGDYSRWVNDGMLHSVTNYELHKGIYSAHNTQNYFEMAHSVQRLFGPYGLCRGANLYNFVDNHDVDRIYNKLTVKANLKPVYIFLFTILGIPSVYYGSEWGIEGCKIGGSDDGLRPAIDIEHFENPNPEITKLIKTLCRAKAAYDELSFGEYKELLLKNKQYVYMRSFEDKVSIVALNNDSQPEEIWIRLPMAADTAVNILTGEVAEIADGQLHFTIGGNDGALIRLNR